MRMSRHERLRRKARQTFDHYRNPLLGFYTVVDSPSLDIEKRSRLLRICKNKGLFMNTTWIIRKDPDD